MMSSSRSVHNAAVDVPQVDAASLFARREEEGIPLATHVLQTQRYLALKCTELIDKTNYLNSLRELTERYRQDLTEVKDALCKERLGLDTAQPEASRWRRAAVRAQETFEIQQEQLETEEKELQQTLSARRCLETENCSLRSLITGKMDAPTTVEILDLSEGKSVTPTRALTPRKVHPQSPSTVPAPRAALSLSTAHFPHLPTNPARPVASWRESTSQPRDTSNMTSQTSPRSPKQKHTM